MGFFDLFKKKQNTQPTTPAEQSQPTSPENHRSATVGNTTGNDNKQGNDSPQPTNRTADREQAELNTGLEKTKTGLFSKLARAVAGRSTIDTQVLDDLEEVLITSDVGVETTVKIIERIEARVARDKYMNTSELQSILRDEIAQLMEESHRSTENFGLDVEEGVPYVIMVVGVNGAGKTTTIGKLAAQLTRAGLNVYIGAADTFRAAAIDQLAVWAERAGATMIRQEMGSDPASVAFDTLKSAVANKADVVLMDDKPSKIAKAMEISKRTLRIVRQNIVFALAVKLLVLALTPFGIANMWEAVFADVGVMVIAILNASRALKAGKK